ncbi:MAG: hypothetical protein ACYCWB_08305 [Thiobacillus sp.]|jgi:hypothetical protein
MIDPFIAAAFLVLWTVLAGTLLFGTASQKLAFWGSVAVAFIIGVLFTSGAFHIRNAFLNPLLSRSWALICIGIVWSAYLALPTIILAKVLSAKHRVFAERFGYSVVAALLQAVICIVPSVPWFIIFSFE